MKVLNTDNYNNFDSELPLHANHAEALKKAREVEKIQKYYLDSAKVTKSLMVDIPRVFERIAKKRDKRKIKLKSLK